MPYVEIDLKDRLEAGALFLSHLFYPDAPERISAHTAAITRAPWAYRRRVDPEWANQNQLLKPAIALMSDSEFERGVKQSVRRMQASSTAGSMALAFLHTRLTGISPPDGVKLSVLGLAEHYVDLSPETDPQNVVKRCWSPWKPVLPAAASLVSFLEARARDGSLEHPADVQHVPGLLEDVLVRAEKFEQLVLDDARIRVDEAKLIRFRVA